MRSFIICACIFLPLQQISANRHFMFNDLSSIQSSECSSSSLSDSSDFSRSSSSSSSSSDSSSSISCDVSSYITIPPSIIPIPYLSEKRRYAHKDITINRSAKIPLLYKLRSKASRESSDSSCTSSSSASSSFSFDSRTSSSCEDSSGDSSDFSCSSSSFSSSSSSSCSYDPHSSSSCEDSSGDSSDSSCSSSSPSDSNWNSSCEDPSDESSDSSCSSSSPSDSSSSSSCEDPSDESSDSSCSSSSPSDSSSSCSSEDPSEDIIPIDPCPPGKSLHAKEDVIAMIDYTAKSLSIYESINNSYYSEAIAVHDKYINDFKQFRNWFQNRPERLKFVLEDLADKRLNLEPRVKKVAELLHESSQLEQDFTERLDRTNTLLKILKSYRTICKHNCNVEYLRGIGTSKGQDEYICSSLEDLHREISSKVKSFETKMKVTLHDKVANDDKVFNENINILKNNLKDVALREFGRTMYDVLNLQDEYDRFIKYITGINPMSYLYDIKQTILNIDAKLFELENEIEDYGDYCRSCRANDPWSLRHNAGVLSQHKKRKNNILDDLLNQKFTNIESSINEDYANIFQDLNTLLNDTDIEDVFSKELKPIQNEVIEMLQKERVNFNELKKIAPQSSIEKLINVSQLSRKLLSDITEAINSLDQN